MDNLERMVSYATEIIGQKTICANQEETIKRIVEIQPDIVLEAYGIQVDIESYKTDNSIRLQKYCDLLKAFPLDTANHRQQERLAAYAQKMESVIRAYAKYDYSKEGRITVNGNTFTYNKEKFNPMDHMKELEDFGEDIQGELLSVSQDEDGRLVIY